MHLHAVELSSYFTETNKYKLLINSAIKKDKENTDDKFGAQFFKDDLNIFVFTTKAFQLNKQKPVT